jgi:hypothetical protein
MQVLDKYPPTPEKDLESELCRQIENFVYKETRRRPTVITLLTRSYFS